MVYFIYKWEVHENDSDQIRPNPTNSDWSDTATFGWSPLWGRGPIYGLNILWGASKLVTVKYGMWANLLPEIRLFEHDMHTILIVLYINSIKGS